MNNKYNYVFYIIHVKSRANGRNIVGQQLLTLLRLFACSEKFDWFQTFRNNCVQHATGCENGRKM